MVLSSNENNFTLEYASIDSNSYFFPFDDSVMDYSDEQNFSNNKLTFEVLDDFNKSLKGVINIGQNYYEVEQISEPVVADTVSGISLLTAIIFAFLGGLILNLMPCVLPVIALKGLSLVKSSAESNSSVTLNASAYVVGVSSNLHDNRSNTRFPKKCRRNDWLGLSVTKPIYSHYFIYLNLWNRYLPHYRFKCWRKFRKIGKTYRWYWTI